MESGSRRAFLTGRRVSKDPWEAFCQRMRRMATGTFFEFDKQEDVGSARLIPKQAGEVQQARALCEEYGVLMALDGVPHAARLNGQPVLWVEPGRELAGCQRLEPGSTKWFVQPGCLLGELEAAGLHQFASLPCHITVAAWLADRTLCDWEAGHTHKSGIEHASVLLADGTSANLGMFGHANQKPLKGAQLQKLIPQLFQIAAQPDAQACRQQSRWPARYRLDALLPADGQTVNLAHLMLGHGGDLGWLEWVVIDERLAQPMGEASYEQRYSPGKRARDGLALPASEVDAHTKSLFDPLDLFPYPGQEL